MLITIITAIIVILVIWWFLEFKKHRKFLKNISIIIHVNGSRGKSSVTRLIGGALRENVLEH